MRRYGFLENLPTSLIIVLSIRLKSFKDQYTSYMALLLPWLSVDVDIIDNIPVINLN